MRSRRSLFPALLVVLCVVAALPAPAFACYKCKYTVSRAIVVASCIFAGSNETGYSGCTTRAVPGENASECVFSGNFCTIIDVGGGGGGAGGGSGSGGGGTCAGGAAGCPAECFSCGGGGGGPAN